MKTLSVLVLATLSFGAFANPFTELENSLSTILNEKEIQGQDAKGNDCKITKYQGQVSIVNYAPGCIDESTNTVDLDCFAQFNYNQHPSRMSAKKLVLKDNYILAEVKSKDIEQYSSAVTSRIEIKAGAKTSVKISDTKKFFGGFKRVQECTF